jgi:hypothetical protein
MFSKICRKHGKKGTEMTMFKECSKYSQAHVKIEWEKLEEVGV